MVFVITGGPGFGKTTVVNLLDKLGFPVGHESARALLSNNIKQNESVNRLQIPPDFERIVATKRIEFLQSIDREIIAFSDRGLPDQIAYSWYKKKTPSVFLSEMVSKNRYAPNVFVTPPWQSIFVQDEIRRETYEEAIEIHSSILKAYAQNGYDLVNLPLVNPEERIGFILNFLGI